MERDGTGVRALGAFLRGLEGLAEAMALAPRAR